MASICSHVDGCALFPLIRSENLLKIWQVRYCMDVDGYKKCARYTLACEGQPIPLTLLPNGQNLTGLTNGGNE